MARRSKGEGTVYFDKARKRYIGELTIGGKTRRVLGCSKSEVYTKITQLRLDIAEKRISIEPNRQKVGDYLKGWLDTLELAPSTILRAKDLLKHVLPHPFANLK